MIYRAFVNRQSDKLLLVTTVDNDANLNAIIQKAQGMIQQISPQSRPKESIPIGGYILHYNIFPPLISACITNNEIASNTAQDFLAEINSLFLGRYGNDKIQNARQEYSFMDFHVEIDAIRTRYMKSIQMTNIQLLQKDLNTVHQTMANNVRSAITTGEKLGNVERISSDLKNSAGMFSKNAADLNRLHFWRTYGRPTVIILIVIVLYYIATFI